VPRSAAVFRRRGCAVALKRLQRGWVATGGGDAGLPYLDDLVCFVRRTRDGYEDRFAKWLAEQIGQKVVGPRARRVPSRSVKRLFDKQQAAKEGPRRCEPSFAGAGCGQ